MGYGRGRGYGYGRGFGEGYGQGSGRFSGYNCVKFVFFAFNVLFWVSKNQLLFLSTPVHIHSGHICIAFCPSVGLSVTSPKFKLEYRLSLASPKSTSCSIWCWAWWVNRHCKDRSCIWPQPNDPYFYLSMLDLFGIPNRCDMERPKSGS